GVYCFICELLELMFVVFLVFFFFFFFQAEDGIRDKLVTGVQTCALPISGLRLRWKGCPGSGGGRLRGARRGSASGAANRSIAMRRCATTAQKKSESARDRKSVV